MAKKGKRKNKGGKKKLQDILIIYGIAAVFLILGIYGIISSNHDFKEYQNSPDVRTVEGVVTKINSKTDIVEVGGKDVKEITWYTDLEFEVDGVTYTDSKTYYKTQYEISLGDVMEIEVYQTSKGDYKIPEISNGASYVITKIFCYASLVVGFLIALAQTVVLVK